MSVNLPIIADHHSPLGTKFGLPRQAGLVPLKSQVIMRPAYADPLAFDGLGQCTHLWLMWYFNQTANTCFTPRVRPPRLGGNMRMGVFATRSMFRPAPIGLSVVRLCSIDIHDGICLHIEGADLADKTPIFDIKPYVPYSDALGDARCWAQRPNPQTVTLSAQAQDAFTHWIAQGILNAQDASTIQSLIAEDPRPAYKHKSPRHFFMRFGMLDVVFGQEDGGLRIFDLVMAQDAKKPCR